MDVIRHDIFQGDRDSYACICQKFNITHHSISVAVLVLAHSDLLSAATLNPVVVVTPEPPRSAAPRAVNSNTDDVVAVPAVTHPQPVQEPQQHE